MKCAHCKKSKAVAKWTLQACVDDRTTRVVKLCTRCDIELNAVVMRFLNIEDHERKIKKYEHDEMTS